MKYGKAEILKTILIAALGALSCGGPQNDSTSGVGASDQIGHTRSVGLILKFPEGYGYDQSRGAIYPPPLQNAEAAPSYITSVTLTVTGGDNTYTYDVPLTTGIVDLSIVVGEYTFSVTVITEFGDTFTGSTTVTLTEGENPPISISLEVNGRPTANSISVSNESPATGDTISFTANFTDDDDNDTYTFAWSVSAGSVSGTGQTVSWTAPEETASVTISLTVSDDKGGVSDSVSITIEILAKPVINSVTTSDSSPYIGAEITLTCEATDANGDSLSYNWSGGTTGSGASITYTVTTSDAVTFICTVSDGTFSVSENVSINSVETKPTNLQASVATDNITLTWDPISNTRTNSSLIGTAITGSVSYNLYWSTTTGTGTGGTKISSVSSGYVHSGRTYGTTYYYVVTSVTDGGESEASNEANAKPDKLLAGLFTDSNLQTCVDGYGKTYASELTNINCASKGIVSLTGLEYLTNLTVLGLNSNSIVTVTPIASLTKLTQLRANANNIVDVSSLTSLATNLTDLRLHNNDIVNVTPIASLVNLTALWLNSNNLDGTSSVDSLVALTSMTALNIQSNSSMSCAKAHTMICGSGNTVVTGACTPASTGLGTSVDITGDGVGNIDTPTNGTNCTNP
jgi:Leucine-rich repeat (LRR) protein